MPRFLKLNSNLNISVRLLDAIKFSESDCKIYQSKIFGKGKKIIDILFHKSRRGARPGGRRVDLKVWLEPQKQGGSVYFQPFWLYPTV